MRISEYDVNTIIHEIIDIVSDVDDITPLIKEKNVKDKLIPYLKEIKKKLILLREEILKDVKDEK